jgi:hypothetical protein
MILMDWTRMGKLYCLAGAVIQDGQVRLVRPLLNRQRDASVRNVGWSPYLLDGHRRWEVFELVGVVPAGPEPPHLEDVWVRSLRSRNCLAQPALRRAILQATIAPTGEPLFGVHLTGTAAAAYLRPGTGCRGLATLVLPTRQVGFHVSWRQGTQEPDIRVELQVPGLSERQLPLKDHHLLMRCEQALDLPGRLQLLHRALEQMGDQVAVRLGLSRPFQPRADTSSFCRLMVDGFFSLNDPQH